MTGRRCRGRRPRIGRCRCSPESAQCPGARRLAPAPTGRLMTDEYMMRARLQQVAAYRALRRAVRRTGRENVFFAGVMIALAYYMIGPNAKGIGAVIFLLYVGLALAEFAVGVFKWLGPSAEGILLDAIILLLFAGWNIGWQVI